jgi:hypothetical protein
LKKKIGEWEKTGKSVPMLQNLKKSKKNKQSTDENESDDAVKLWGWILEKKKDI